MPPFLYLAMGAGVEESGYSPQFFVVYLKVNEKLIIVPQNI